MARLGDFTFFHSVMKEMQDSRDRMVKMKQAKLDNEQRNKLNDLKIQQAELDIETKRAEGKVDKFESQIMEKILSDMKKANKANVEVEDDISEVAATKEKNRMKGLISEFGTGVREIQEDGQTSFGASIPGFDVDFSKKVGPFTIKSKKKKTDAQKFDDDFKRADLGQISFDDLNKSFPGKRKEIKEQRILGLPEKSQRLLSQINREILADEKRINEENAQKKKDVRRGEIPQLIRPDPEIVVQEFLTEIVQNRDEADLTPSVMPLPCCNKNPFPSNAC